MKKYLRFLFGLRTFLKGRIDTAEAIELARTNLRKRLQSREESFLNLVKKGVFENPNSPYRKLLDPKHITFDDLRNWVAKDGLEVALAQLQREGIYFTIEEYKGIADVSRNGLRFRIPEKAFDNPFLTPAYEVRSGATRSAGTRVMIDFDHLVKRSFYDAFVLNLHDSLNSPIANWFPVFPGAPGINSSLRLARIGNPPKKWFSQVDKRLLKVNWEKRLKTNYIIVTSKMMGVPLAKPEFVDLNNAYRVAKWASRTLQDHPNCVVYTFASSAIRVCRAAKEHDLNIKGTRFLVTGEPLTPQKRKEIEAVGGRVISVYGISEAGVVAAACDRPFAESDHCHTFKDTIAVTSYKRNVPQCDTEVDSLLFSSLSYEAPKILLNVEMGDYGVLKRQTCGCEFGKLGFDQHISDIRGFDKLTGEGVTFVNTDFVRIIEEVLPKRFGGESTDYQLVEAEDESGLTRLKLMVSPVVGKVNEQEVVNTFVQLLRSAEDDPQSWAQPGAQMWVQAETVRVVRDYPIPTKRAKILPFHILKGKE